MKMKMVDSVWKQNNFLFVMKLLKELYKELKIRDDWLVSWVQSYCCLSYCWS